MLLIDQVLHVIHIFFSSLYCEKVADVRKDMMKIMYAVAGFTWQCDDEPQLFITLALGSCNGRN